MKFELNADIQDISRMYNEIISEVATELLVHFANNMFNFVYGI